MMLSKNKGWSDCLTGLPVALLALPQAMAYALVAHLPISTGIFSAIFATIIAARFGNSKYLVLGPTNTVAILLQSGTAQIIFHRYQGLPEADQAAIAIGIMAQIGLMVGLLQLTAAAFQLGKLTQFVSRSVIVGYLLAAALVLGTNQLFPFFGLTPLEGYHSLLEKLGYLAHHLHEVDPITLSFGLCSLFALIILNRLLPNRFPRAAAMLGIATLVSITWTTLTKSPPTQIIENYGGIDQLFPTIQFPKISIRLLNELFPTAVAIALLGILEVSSLAKSVSKDEAVDTDQDVKGMGLGNLVASFLGAMPISASPSRTVLNATSGALSYRSAVWSGLWLLVLVAVFGRLIPYIPLPSLSALLLLMAATRVVNRKQLATCFNATQSDRAVLLITAISALFLSLHIAFFIGVLVSITFYLSEAARPLVIDSEPQDPRIRLVEVEGELFFGAAEHLNEHLQQLARDQQAQVIILQLRGARHLDATGCLIIEQIAEQLRREGRTLLACDVPAPIWSVIERSGTVNRWGKTNLFRCDLRDPNNSLHAALKRAKTHLDRV